MILYRLTITSKGTIDPKSNTKAYEHMKANTVAHILIVSDSETDENINKYREDLYTHRHNTGYPE